MNRESIAWGTQVDEHDEALHAKKGVGIGGALATEAKQNFLVGMSIPAHDHLALTVATTTDTWVYKTGGAAGTTVATVLVTYTDSGKGTITTIAKS